MNRLQRLANQPLITYLVIFTFSGLAAYFFWTLGGSFAEVISSNPALGVTFELGGAIAGFVSVLLVSMRAFTKLYTLQAPLRRIKVFFIPRDEFPVSESYECTVWIYDSEIGDERTEEPIPRHEAGYLTVDLRDLRNTETFRIQIRNSHNEAWESEYHHVAASRAEMQRV